MHLKGWHCAGHAFAVSAMAEALGPRDEGRIFPLPRRSDVYEWGDQFLKPLGKT